MRVTSGEVRKGNQIVLLGVLVALFCAALIFRITTERFILHYLLIVSATAVFLAVVVFRRRILNDDDLLHPVHLVGGFHLFMFLWSPMVHDRFPLFDYHPSDSLYVLLIASCGYYCFLLGFWLIPGGRLVNLIPQPTRSWKERDYSSWSRAKALGVMLAAAITYVYVYVWYYAGGLGNYVEHYLELQMDTPSWGYYAREVLFPVVHVSFLLWLALMLGKKRFGLGATFIVLAITVFAFLTTLLVSRRNLIALGFGAVLVFHYFYRRLGKKTLTVVLASAIAIFGFTGVYRQMTLVGTDYLRRFEGPKAYANFALWSFDQFDTMIVVVNGLEAGQMDYALGLPWTGIAVRFVPRDWWPKKPPTTAMYVGRQLLTPLRRFNTWRAVSVLADLYMNLSWFGVAVGMALLGLFVQVLDQLRKTTKSGLFMYVACFPLLLASLRSEITMAVQWVFIFYMLSWFLLTICLRKALRVCADDSPKTVEG